MPSTTEGEATPTAEEQKPSATEVRHALECLYDNASLASTVLAYYYPEVAALEDALERAEALRSLLLDALALLKPLQRTADYARSIRDYEVLSLRYVSGLSVDQIASQLNVGPRQIYRDLRRAEEKLRTILDDRALATRFRNNHVERATAMRDEIAITHTGQQTVSACDIVHAAVATTEGLARSRQVRLHLDIPPGAVVARGVPGMLRATMTQLLSHTIQLVSDATISLHLSCQERRPQLSISFESPSSSFSSLSLLLSDSLNSARAVGLECILREEGEGRWQLQVHLPPALPQLILIVEDNPGAVNLYERYLEGTGWRLVSVGEASQVLSAVRQHHPDVILLDVMMPDIDGWTVLQDLRMDPDTASVPIVVCSVMHDPGLAAALGASAYLTKPVSRLELLSTLRRFLESVAEG